MLNTRHWCDLGEATKSSKLRFEYIIYTHTHIFNITFIINIYVIIRVTIVTDYGLLSLKKVMTSYPGQSGFTVYYINSCLKKVLPDEMITNVM